MTVRDYQVHWQTPQQLLRNPDSPSRVYNRDTVQSVYVSNEYVGGTNGFRLGPGMSLTWTTGRDLWIWSTPEATLPVPVTVVNDGGEFTDPSTIATAILEQGLAQQIADAISITGVPPSNLPVLLGSHTWTGLSPSTHAFTPAADVGKYQSLFVKFSPDTAFPDDQINQWVILNGDNIRAFNVCWNSDGDTTEVTLPVLSTELSVTRIGPDIGLEETVEVFGTYATQKWGWRGANGTAPLLGTVPGECERAGTFEWNVGAKPVGPFTNFVGGIQGAAKLTVRVNATVAGLVTMYDALTGAVLVRITIPGGGGSLYYDADFILPIGASIIELSNSLVASTMTVSIVYQA